MREKLTISIVIPTKDRPQDIIRCIGSILIQALLPDEIIIVDASDGQKLKSRIGAFKSGKINFIYIHTRPGLTYQRNVGIATSSGDIIIFLDDDVILDKEYIQNIMKVFENDLKKNVGGVTGNNMFKKPQSPFRHLIGHCYRTAFLLSIYSNGKFRLSGHPTFVHEKVKKVLPIECLAGCNMAFRREIFEEFQFDKNLHGYAYMEDCDIAYRVSQKYKNMYTPFAKLVHNVSPISRDKEYARMKMEIENHHYLFKKNFPQDLKYRFAFWWSVAGLFVRQACDLIMMREGGREGLKGLIDGIINIKLHS
jgi:GT2 family glycosyltransferase